MNSSTLWTALVLSCIACGSSFHSDEAAGGSGGSLGSAGGDVGRGGTSSAGTSSAGTSSAGTSSAGTSSAGTSSGGVIGVGGDVSIAGTVSFGGVIGVAGDIGIAGAPLGGNVGTSGGPSGGASGSVGTAGSAGSGGADCTKLWTTYWNLVLKAQACDAGSTSCVANSNIINECSCAVPVNSSGSTYSEAKKALQAYKAASCPLKQCPCAVPGPVSCLPSSGGSAYSCQPSVVTTQ